MTRRIVSSQPPRVDPQKEAKKARIEAKLAKALESWGRWEANLFRAVNGTRKASKAVKHYRRELAKLGE